MSRTAILRSQHLTWPPKRTAGGEVQSVKLIQREAGKPQPDQPDFVDPFQKSRGTLVGDVLAVEDDIENNDGRKQS